MAKVENKSVPEQPHELKYEAKKEGTTAKKVEAAKKAGASNHRKEVEEKLIGQKKQNGSDRIREKTGLQ